MTNRINMFDALAEASSGQKKKAGSAPSIIAIFVIAALNVIVIAALLTASAIKSGEVRQLNEYLSTPEAVDIETRHLEASDELFELEDEVAALQMMSYYYQLHPSFNTNTYNQVMECKPDNTSVQSFAFKVGTITVNCTTPDNMPPADFTKALQDSAMFSSVGYSGFSTDIYGNVIFPIVCVLNPVGGA